MWGLPLKKCSGSLCPKGPGFEDTGYLIQRFGVKGLGCGFSGFSSRAAIIQCS